MEIKDVRRQNLLALIEEIGTQAELADLCEIPKQYISQIVNQAPGANGTPRAMGSKTARRLEECCKKPQGWMDAPHTAAPVNPDRDRLISLYDKLDEKSQKFLVEQAAGLYNMISDEKN